MVERVANQEEIAYWNGPSGERWVSAQARVDAMVGPIADVVLEDGTVRPGMRALDVGCGCGGSSLGLAERVGPAGAVLGVDVSRPMLERARERAAVAGHDNLRFVEADAQTYALPTADIVHSRFGVMFFSDPVAAFSNLRRSLARSGSLVAVVWQPAERNPWLTAPAEIVSDVLDVEASRTGDPGAGPFSLEDPSSVRDHLAAAGFGGIDIQGVEGAVNLGSTVAEAVDFTLNGVGPVARAATEASPEAKAEATWALSNHFAGLERAGGLDAPAAVWIIRAMP